MVFLIGTNVFFFLGAVNDFLQTPFSLLVRREECAKPQGSSTECLSQREFVDLRA